MEKWRRRGWGRESDDRGYRHPFRGDVEELFCYGAEGVRHRCGELVEHFVRLKGDRVDFKGERWVGRIRRKKMEEDEVRFEEGEGTLPKDL